MPNPGPGRRPLDSDRQDIEIAGVFASAAFLTVNFVRESILWNPVEKIEKVVDERDQSVETGNNNNSMSNDNNETSQSIDPSEQNPTSNNIQSAEANSDIPTMSTIVEIPPRTKKVTKRKKKVKKKKINMVLSNCVVLNHFFKINLLHLY